MIVPAAPVSGGRPEVVGREAEQARIDAFLDALPRGARALVITGEPGIGKTALWRHGLERCRATEVRLLVASPADEELPRALVGLTDLVESAGLDATDLQVEASQLARGRALLAELRGLADGTPTVIAIDDAQWLDPASAQTLRFALRRLDPEAVGCSRPCAPRPKARTRSSSRDCSHPAGTSSSSSGR